MDTPIEIFLSLIAFTFAMGVIGLWKKIPIMLFIAGAVITFWAIMTDNITLSYSQLTNSTQISEVIVSNTTVYHYNIESSTTNLNTANFTGMFYGRAEVLASGGGSILAGDVLQCIDLYLAKVGSPTSPSPERFITVGVFPISSATIPTRTFGSMTAESLTTTLTWYTFCVAEGNEHVLNNGDRIGFIYRGGNSTNYVLTRMINSDVFDGANTQRISAQFGSPTFNTAISTEDMTMRMYDFELATAIIEDFDQSIQPNTFEFTEYPKILFGIIGAIIMLAGAMIWKYEEN